MSFETPLLAALKQCGWACHKTEVAADIISETRRVGSVFGSRARGRAGALEELIEPQVQKDAHPRSLSAQYGLGALPFHTDLSHRPRPCRYLLLGCIDPGSPGATTKLLDWQGLALSEEERRLLEAAPILVRNGRRSFYTTILSPQFGFLRYDPGCVEAVDERGNAALCLMKHRLATSRPTTHQWRRGDILIIDNWRVLHARGHSELGSGRRLARILIDA